jgi:hypothetical protein
VLLRKQAGISNNGRKSIFPSKRTGLEEVLVLKNGKRFTRKTKYEIILVSKEIF